MTASVWSPKVVADPDSDYWWTGLHTFKSGIGDPAILNTEQTSVRIARSSPFGGSGHPSPVQSPLVIDHLVNEGTTSFEWSLIARNSNYSSGVAANDCVALYGQAYKYAPGGRSWGVVAEVQDKSGDTGAGILCGVEIDVFANGTVGAVNRIGMEIVFGKGVAAGAQNLTDVCIRIMPAATDKTQAKLNKAIECNIDCAGAFIKLQNNMNARYLIEAETAGSIDYFLRFKTASQPMFLLNSSGGTLGTYVGRLKVVIDEYEYWLPVYGGGVTPIPM